MNVTQTVFSFQVHMPYEEKLQSLTQLIYEPLHLFLQLPRVDKEKCKYSYNTSVQLALLQLMTAIIYL